VVDMSQFMGFMVFMKIYKKEYQLGFNPPSKWFLNGDKTPTPVIKRQQS
jgi:hypothetical protein